MPTENLQTSPQNTQGKTRDIFTEHERDFYRELDLNDVKPTNSHNDRYDKNSLVFGNYKITCNTAKVDGCNDFYVLDVGTGSCFIVKYYPNEPEKNKQFNRLNVMFTAAENKSLGFDYVDPFGFKGGHCPAVAEMLQAKIRA